MTKTATFAATSEIQTWVVPAGVSKVTIECFGAAGGGRKGDTDAQRSPGGYAKGDLAVTAGETLWLYVGGAAPHAGNVSSPGGWNGGGAGGTVTPGAGGGGGATDVRQGGTAPANRKIVAAGGGGHGATWSSSGGAGGGTGGASGAGGATAMGGGGGTQTAGGAGGHGNSGDGSDGALRLGGAGSDSGLGGGGGGGYYGGGGGGGAGGVGGVGGGGGGGSSYIGGVTNASTVTGGGSSLDGSIVITYNVPPNAPALDWVDGTVIPRTTANRLPWQFSDTDPANTQSKFDLRHRPVGATAWTLITEEVPNTFWDAPAGTFSEGDHEWQVRTYDQFGEPGPYSPSAFLTAVTPGPGPTITTPVNGAPVAATQMLGWSITDQDAYQVRVLDENAAVVPGSDTGRVADSSARSHLVTYDANNVTRTTQLRTEDAGLWSDWVEVTNPVSYTPPLAPEVTVSPVPNKGALLVEVTNPTPAGGEPDAAWNDIYVDDGDGFERRAAFIAPNGSWLYPTPISGRNYGGRIRVRTYAANGTWTETTTATSGDPVTGPFQYGGGYA